MLADKYEKVEVQPNVLNGRLTAYTAYYGELATIKFKKKSNLRKSNKNRYF